MQKKDERNLHYLNIEGIFASVSESIMTSFLTPLALSLKATHFQIGMMNSYKALASTAAQLPAPKVTGYFGSRKVIWAACNFFSRVLWLVMIFSPFFVMFNAVDLLIFVVATSSFFAALKTPAWSSLAAEIVPDDIRGKYFGRRNMLAGIAGLLATVAGGYVLAKSGFSLLYGISIIFGILAVIISLRISEPAMKKEFQYRYRITMNLGDIVNAIRIHRNLVIFTIYLALVNLTTNIASPFFSIYMLENLKIDYTQFALLTAIEALVAIIGQPYWGKLSDRFGDKAVISVTGLLVCFVPLMWLFIRGPTGIALANIFSGFVWAGFNLAAFNFLLSVTPYEKRTDYIANHTLIINSAVVIGTLLGSHIAQMVQSTTFMWMSGLQLIFLVSFVSRLLCTLLIPALHETRVKEEGDIHKIFLNSVVIGPAKGLTNTIAFAFMFPNHVEISWNVLKKAATRVYYKYKIRE